MNVPSIDFLKYNICITYFKTVNRIDAIRLNKDFTDKINLRSGKKYNGRSKPRNISFLEKVGDSGKIKETRNRLKNEYGVNL